MDEAAERFDLFGAIGFAHGELCAREDPFLVQECSVWAHIPDLIERARAPEESSASVPSARMKNTMPSRPKSSRKSASRTGPLG
jgi:hypothetical protein